MRYKHIHFIEANPLMYPCTNGHAVYICRNNKFNADLGYVIWDTRWKQYVFSQIDDAVIYFGIICLRDLADFMERRNNEI